MQKKYKVILVISFLLVTCLLFAVLTFNKRRIICTWDIDEPKLNALMAAIIMYENDYGELPPEVDFKKVMLEKNILDKEDVFYSGHKGTMLLRYFQDGESFVLVGPGKNKIYDTPKGYKNIRDSFEKFEQKTDDIIKLMDLSDK